VREGLRRLVRRAGLPPADDAGPTGARTRWRNGLLDLVGSDARPLADLLLRLEAHGVAAAIPAGPLAPAAWAPVRARLAFAYAAETFLDAEMARWAVDAWAYATGAIDTGALYVAPPVVSPVAPPVVLGAMPVAARPAVAGGGAPMALAPASATPAYGSPAFAGSTFTAGATARPGKIPGRVRRAMARANAPPAPNPFPKNFDRIAGLTFMGMVAAAAGAMWMGIAERREAGGLEAPAPVDARFAGVGATAPAIAPLVGGAVAPAGDAPAGGGPTASRGPGARGAGAALGVDSLRLRDGTMRTGVVERVTPDGLVVRDPWSDVTSRLGFDSIVEWRPRPGERVPVGALPGGSDAAGTAATGGPGPPPAPPEGAGESGTEPDATVGDAGPGGYPPIRASAAAYGGPPARATWVTGRSSPGSPVATRCAGGCSTSPGRRAAARWPPRSAARRPRSRPWRTGPERQSSPSRRVPGCAGWSTTTGGFAPGSSPASAAGYNTGSGWSASSSRTGGARKPRARRAPFSGGATCSGAA
jgi:hypothetical protein